MTQPTPEERLVSRLRGLIDAWRREANDFAASGGRRAAITACARQAEMILEELGLKDVKVKGTALRPARGPLDPLDGRVCSFALDFLTPCTATGPVWDLILYDRAVIEGEPFVATEIGRKSCCFAHGAAEQRRRREADRTEED